MKLSAEGKNLFHNIKQSYGIHDPAGEHILQTACEAFDTMRAAQKAVRKFGVVTLDERGRPKANPAAQVERDSRAAMLNAFKMLKIEIPVNEKF